MNVAHFVNDLVEAKRLVHRVLFALVDVPLGRVFINCVVFDQLRFQLGHSKTFVDFSGRGLHCKRVVLVRLMMVKDRAFTALIFLDRASWQLIKSLTHLLKTLALFRTTSRTTISSSLFQSEFNGYFFSSRRFLAVVVSYQVGISGL